VIVGILIKFGRLNIVSGICVGASYFSGIQKLIRPLEECFLRVTS